MFVDLSYFERDMLMLQYKKAYLNVYGIELSKTDELVLIRSNVSKQELVSMTNRLDMKHIASKLYNTSI